MRFALATLGCKVNAFESELIAQKLEKQSYSRAAQDEPADLFILNSCTVTAEADRQARQLVRRAIRRNPDAWVVVTGCYAQVDADTCAAIPGVDLVVGNGRKLDIPELLDGLYRGDLPPVMVDELDKEISLPDQLLQGYEGRTRAFVQVQQGCDQGCTFCIIHTARGPNRSFDAGMIRRQVERLVINGYREIVLCGVDVGSYGSDLPNHSPDLASLLRQLVSVEGDFRLRLSSIDPAHLDDDLIEVLATEPKICPQLHLSMQSGNTLILKRMKRRATREILEDRIGRYRSRVPDAVLSADILVGFPTETAEQFLDTLSAIDDLDIAYPHVFSYSPRPGTPAARIPRQVDVAERRRRAALAREIGQQVWRRSADRRIGRSFRLLVEQEGDGESGCLGRAADYFPVRLPGVRADSGDWIEAEINAVGEAELIARVAG